MQTTKDSWKQAVQLHKRLANFDKLSKINDISLSSSQSKSTILMWELSTKLSKFTRQTINMKGGNLGCRPLELVHMDPCGPMHVSSIGGVRYLYVIIDDYTWKTFAHSLSCKEDTF